MTRKQEISNIIVLCLKDMVSLRKKEFKGKWADFDNEEGNVNRLEGLMCFLLALDNLEGRRDEIYDIFPKDDLKRECQNIIKDDETKQFYGTPYIDVTDVEGNHHGFIDAACFTLSLIYYYDKLWEIKSSDTAICQELFVKALEFIDGCLVKKMGFQFTNYGTRPEPANYTTWMALDKLEDVLSIEVENSYVNKKALRILKKLRNDKIDILDRFESEYIDSTPRIVEDEECNMSITKARVEYDKDDRFIHYNLWIILSLLFLRTKKGEKILEALQIVEIDHQDTKRGFENVTNRAWDYYFENDEILKEGKAGTNLNKFSGRAFLSQYLKCVTLFCQHFPKYEKQINTSLQKAYGNLLNNRFTDETGPVSYWDANSKEGYSITYTEGAVDALCFYYKYLEKTEQPSTAGISDVSALLNLNDLYKVISSSALQIRIDNVNLQAEIDERIDEFLEKSKILNDIKKSVSETQKAIKVIADKMNSGTQRKKISKLKEEATEIFAKRKR